MMVFMDNNTVSLWIAGLGIWPLVIVLVPNLFFRRYKQPTSKKRMASLYQAIAVFIITTVAAFIADRGLTDVYLYAGILIVAVILFFMRARVFPYRLNCGKCGIRLDMRAIYFMDDNLCETCRSADREPEV